MAVTAGDGWLDQGANLLMFGPPGGGKSHLASAIGRIRPATQRLTPIVVSSSKVRVRQSG